MVSQIFNIDQDSEYATDKHIFMIVKTRIKISIDSEGRAYDNIIIEGFWNSLRYENIYLTSYSNKGG